MGYDLDDTYFSEVDGPEVKRGKVHVGLDVQRSDKVFDIKVSVEGYAVVPCDVCLDDMDQPISGVSHITAKLGNGGNDDDIIAIDENEGILDMAWPIYESIALAIPIRHVHAPGKCNPAMIKALNEHSAARSSEGDESGEAVDPRWEGLRKLKNNN